MTLTDRDKKILTLLVPIALIAAYWFLLFAPKREEAASVQEQVTQAQDEQQQAEAQAAQLSGAKTDFASDYTTVIRLGKAVPTVVDMPSLIVQLDRAARGTGIDFDKIATGSRQAAPAEAPAQGGDDQAQSGAGKAVDSATDASKKADAAGAAAQGQPTTAGGQATPAQGASSGAPGLESIPLDFTFTGTYFDLADFLHRMKRFVKVVNDDIVVRGRLITIDSLNWKAEPDEWPKLTAEVHATVYLAPKAEGVSGGATPQGPDATPAPTPAGGGSAPAPQPTPATTAPAATVK